MARRREDTRGENSDDVPDGDRAGSGGRGRQRAHVLRLHSGHRGTDRHPWRNSTEREFCQRAGETLALEAMIPVEAAETFGARIGDRVSAVLPWSDDLAHIEVVISAIYQRKTPEAEVWQLEEEVLQAATGTSFRTMPFHISEEAFLETLGPRLRRMEATTPGSS